MSRYNRMHPDAPISHDWTRDEPAYYEARCGRCNRPVPVGCDCDCGATDMECPKCSSASINVNWRNGKPYDYCTECDWISEQDEMEDEDD